MALRRSFNKKSPVAAGGGGGLGCGWVTWVWWGWWGVGLPMPVLEWIWAGLGQICAGLGPGTCALKFCIGIVATHLPSDSSARVKTLTLGLNPGIGAGNGVLGFGNDVLGLEMMFWGLNPGTP